MSTIPAGDDVLDPDEPVYDLREVAEMLGVAVGTCKAQLHRGRKLLRARLGLPEVDS